MSLNDVKLGGPAKCSKCQFVVASCYDDLCPLCAIFAAREEAEGLRSELATRMKLADDLHEGLKSRISFLQSALSEVCTASTSLIDALIAGLESGEVCLDNDGVVAKAIDAMSGALDATS